MRQAGTVAEEANEKVHIESRKGPRSAEIYDNYTHFGIYDKYTYL